jgi:hypothetical protein
VLEEAAYVEPGFFYETVAPLLLIGNTSLIAISTLTSEINFYTRLLRMRDKVTGLPLFTSISVQLACRRCIEDGRAAACVHMLHLVPRWQSSDRHVKLKTIMQVLADPKTPGKSLFLTKLAQDRPDLIESELSGLAFDSLQQVFKPEHLEVMFNQPAPAVVVNEDIHLFIDPAAGGPYSDYAMLSVTRQKGLITVRARRPLRRLEVPARGVRRVPVGPVHRKRGVARHQRPVRARGGARLAPDPGERVRERREERGGDQGGEHGPAERAADLYIWAHYYYQAPRSARVS